MTVYETLRQVTNTPQKKTRMVCKNCQSDKVKADAYAVWDGYSWMILSVHDKGSWCDRCDGETTIEEKDC